MAGTASSPALVMAVAAGYKDTVVSAGDRLTRWVAPMRAAIGGVQAQANTAGTGTGTTVLDVLKNGSSIWATSTNRPTLAATSTGAFQNTRPTTRGLNAGDVLEIQVASVSSSGHARLAVSVAIERAS